MNTIYSLSFCIEDHELPEIVDIMNYFQKQLVPGPFWTIVRRVESALKVIMITERSHKVSISNESMQMLTRLGYPPEEILANLIRKEYDSITQREK